MSNSNFAAPIYDVLVVGSGAAGLYAALQIPSHYRVGLITKKELQAGASDWAQGGIAAAINPEDSPKFHLNDTLKAGAGLCDRQAVGFLVENAKTAINSLVEMGVAFDRKGQDAELAMTLEAAHSRPRVLHAADTTGRAIVSILTEQVLQRPNIQVLSRAFALGLWRDSAGKCQGISLLYQQQILWLKSSVVILATGGGGQVFSQTTNPSVSTGDGTAIAWRSGANLRDLEFVQFHPTALTVPGAPRFLISEAVRGEGAHLVDAQGDRFAFQYHPQGELAPRDVVSRAIFTHLQKTGAPNVFLDLRPIPEDKVRYRFPNIIKRCQKWGVDVFTTPIPVTPAAHYWMGGIAVDTTNQTSISGLYAVGETASTGVHGANRLASNSLLECVVYAAQLATLEVEPLAETQTPQAETKPWQDRDWQSDREFVQTIRKELPILVWRSAGICRVQADLESAVEQVKIWQEQLNTLDWADYTIKLAANQQVQLPSMDLEKDLRRYAETLNLVDIGYLILKSALFRTESRGGHYRLDFPEQYDSWLAHTMIHEHQWSKTARQSLI
ncbi:MAG: L-aspartate oxidase [Cyanobacteria bacterium J06642_3]